MFQYVDKVFKKILTDELGSRVNNVNISFVTPDNNFNPDGLSINCFLYDVRENNELHSNEWHFETNPDGSARRVKAPTWVDCKYFVSVWADNVETEHRVLGEIMKVLLSYKKPAEDISSRNIANEDAVKPVITLLDNPVSTKLEMCRALAIKPRPALDYKVTVCVDTQIPERYPIVEEKILDIRVMKEIVS